MACNLPITAFRTRHGQVSLGKELPDSSPLRLPCGKCLGCRTSQAREWALRCHLELAGHQEAAFTTLTYNDENLPPTLTKTHLAAFLRAFRKRCGPTRPIRFFASGEYGETGGRPHYHALLYGADARADEETIEKAWGRGHTRTYPISHARIAYVAGYTQKKIHDAKHTRHLREHVNPDTGEVTEYYWQPPFIEMSRRPGIGANAKQYRTSWREHAVLNGRAVPVPRFLHKAWEAYATPYELEQLEQEKYEKRLLTRHNTTPERLAAKELILETQRSLTAARRKL